MPNDLSGLKLWFRANTIVGLGDGEAVQTWRDESGQGNDITQGTGAARPIYKTDILNGRPVVRFDGVDDYLEATSLGDMGSSVTIFVVVKLSSAGDTSQGLIEITNGSVNTGYSMPVLGSGLLIFRARDSADRDTAGGPARDDVFRIFTGIAVENDKVYHIVNNGPLVSGDNYTTNPNTLTTVGIGRLNVGGLWLNGDLGEIIVYDANKTVTERRSVIRYLSDEWSMGT